VKADPLARASGLSGPLRTPLGCQRRIGTAAPAVTLFELLPAPARAWVVAACIGERPIQDRHDFVRFTSAPNQPGHELHREVDPVEEELEASAQVVQTGVTIGRLDEPVLGAFAVAGEAHIAFLAVARQRGELVLTEPDLLGRSDQFDHVFLQDIAQQILRLDEMVARVHVAVVLDRKARPARLIEDTHAGIGQTQPVAERSLERLHEDLADIVAHPLVEDGGEKAPELLGLDRPVRHGAAFLEQGQPV
jgi:hypothetical protein